MTSPEASQAARYLVRNRWGPRLSPEETKAAIDNLIRQYGSIPKAAKELGVNKQSLYDYRNGKTGMPMKYKVVQQSRTSSKPEQSHSS